MNEDHSSDLESSILLPPELRLKHSSYTTNPYENHISSIWGGGENEIMIYDEMSEVGMESATS